MIAALFFIMAFLLGLGMIMLVPVRKEEKPSFLRSLIVSYITLLSIGAMAAFIICKIKIPVNLVSMGIVYILTAAALFIYCYKKKTIQKYKFCIYDVLNFATIFLIILVVIWRVFSFDLNFNYINSDPGNHFGYAMIVYKYEKVSKMHYSSLYNGLFIKMLTSIIPGFATTKAFIIADTISNFMSGAMFYVLFMEVVEKKLLRKVSPVFTALYFVGWPVYHYVMGGFVYWGAGVTLVILGIYLLNRYDKGLIKEKLFWALILLNLFSIVFCYVLFAPFVAASYGICLFIMYFGKVKNKKKFAGITVLLLLGCMLGVLAFLFFFFKGDFSRFMYFATFDGGIHRSLYKDLIYFIPFVSILFFDMKKKKKMDVCLVSMLMMLLATAVSFVLVLAGFLASYYYYKLYYILWFMGWIITAKGLDIVIEEKQKWVIGYGLGIVFIFIYSFTPLEDMEFNVYNKTVQHYEKNSPDMPMYSVVGSFIKHIPDAYLYPEEKDFFEVVEYVNNLCVEIPVLGNGDKGDSYSRMTGNKRIDENNKKVKNNIENKFFNEMCADKDYFCIEKATKYYKNNHEKLSEEYDIVMDADYGVVYHKKN